MLARHQRVVRLSGHGAGRRLAGCFCRGGHDCAASTRPDARTGDARRHELVSRAGRVERADRRARHGCGAELAVLRQHHRRSANDLAAYEGHRGTSSDFTPSAATLVARVNAHDTSFTDTTAPASTGPHADDYFYIVAVRTRSGQLISGATRFVQLPPPGQTEFVLPAVAAATLGAGALDTIVDPYDYSGLSVSPDIAGRGAERDLRIRVADIDSRRCSRGLRAAEHVVQRQRRQPSRGLCADTHAAAPDLYS